MSTFLPQLDPDPDERAIDLKKAQEDYQFHFHSYVSPLAVLRCLPRGQGFAFLWLLKAAKRALTILTNHIKVESSERKSKYLRRKRLQFVRELALGNAKPDKVLRFVERQLVEAVRDRPRSLEAYGNLFCAIGLPPIHKNFLDDDVFAYQRVAGPNPLMIERVVDRLPDNFAVTAEHYSGVMADDSLDAAIREGRLYLADYQALAGAKNGDNDGVPKYLYAPLALFAVDKTSKKLMPVAIQCEQTPGPENPIFTPHDDKYNWIIAKTIVQVADGNFHEAVSHLGRTHLFVEPFVVSTHRQLACSHPVYKLLCPHFTGTLAINQGALGSLIAPGGQVDQVMAAEIDEVWRLTVAGVQTYLFDENLLPKTFAARGVDDREALPSYPYRDDASQYWEAIHDWVTDYLNLYYPSDEVLQKDEEVRKWYAELASEDGGRVKGMTGDRGSKSYLADVLTMVIFSSSVQHAAVNFPQYDLMSYVPNMPGACYQTRPTATSGASEQDYLDLLPPLTTAETQTEFLYLLGSLHYTCLGKYPRRQFERRVKPFSRNFRTRIQTIDDTIKLANETRLMPYKFLIPKGVPRSINI